MYDSGLGTFSESLFETPVKKRSVLKTVSAECKFHSPIHETNSVDTLTELRRKWNLTQKELYPEKREIENRIAKHLQSRFGSFIRTTVNPLYGDYYEPIYEENFSLFRAYLEVIRHVEKTVNRRVCRGNLKKEVLQLLVNDSLESRIHVQPDTSSFTTGRVEPQVVDLPPSLAESIKEEAPEEPASEVLNSGCKYEISVTFLPIVDSEDVTWSLREFSKRARTQISVDVSGKKPTKDLRNALITPNSS